MRILLALAMVLTAVAGCLDDDAGVDPVDREPVVDDWEPAMLPDPITGLEFVKNAESTGAAGIYTHENKLYLSGGAGLRILDITDPQGSFLLAENVEGTQGSRDVDIMEHPNGRLYAVLAHGGPRISITDVTDPTSPEHILDITSIGSAHNIAVVPGEPIIYNSRSLDAGINDPAGLEVGKIDVIDLTDIANPEITIFGFPAVVITEGGVPKVSTAGTCHDITFLQTDDKDWAFCAGVTETQIWDITDALEPTIIQIIQTPLNQIHHGAWGARDGDILIIGDEFAGAAGGTTCTDPVENPYAALWFWDISDLATPTPLGYYAISYNSATATDPSLCTTHFGTLVEDRDLFVIGWYTAGVGIVDFSDPTDPTEIAHYEPDGATNTWEARYYKGHVYTGDTARGTDILKLI